MRERSLSKGINGIQSQTGSKPTKEVERGGAAGGRCISMEFSSGGWDGPKSKYYLAELEVQAVSLLRSSSRNLCMSKTLVAE